LQGAFVNVWNCEIFKYFDTKEGAKKIRVLALAEIVDTGEETTVIQLFFIHTHATLTLPG